MPRILYQGGVIERLRKGQGPRGERILYDYDNPLMRPKASARPFIPTPGPWIFPNYTVPVGTMMGSWPVINPGLNRTIRTSSECPVEPMGSMLPLEANGNAHLPPVSGQIMRCY